MKKYLITSALPYANGNIHIGHLVEYIQTDIFVRFQRIMGNDIKYFCAVDAHGTPIVLSAERENITPEEMVERYKREDYEDFTSFGISFDCFYTTHSPENKTYSTIIYNALKEKGHIVKKSVAQMYCEKHAMFLPDRYVLGGCPKCGAEEQYGDVCESCNSTYSPVELVKPKCSLCGNKPMMKNSDHYFFALSDYQDALKKWVDNEVELQNDVKKYILDWLKEPLRDWDISRDAPYFGFKIPGEEDKFFYVWLDAPVGYISTAKKYAEDSGVDFDSLWHDKERKVIHVIGKDIIYFHTLFWPAMLMGSGFNLPKRVQVHGMLIVDGQKMSKSRGTFITARKFQQFLNPQYLRFYYASKLSSASDDLDLNFDDFMNRVNAELVNNLANVASRSIQFVDKRLGAKLGKLPPDSKPAQEDILARVQSVCTHFDNWDFGKAVSEICAISDIANRYFQESVPWDVIKTDKEKARDICTFMVNCVKILSVLLKPVLPEFSSSIERMLNIKEQDISGAVFDLECRNIGKFEKLIGRVEQKNVEGLIAVSKEDLKKKEVLKVPPVKEEITIDDFAKLDLRVAVVVGACEVDGADKLLELELDIGLERRKVFAGIKKSYNPEDLLGKQVIMVANLKPRKMKFGISEGMILAGSSGESLFVGEFCGKLAPGAQVK